MNWKNMPRYQKIATIISCLPIAVWLIYRVKSDLFTIDPTCPAIAVFTLCEAIVYWKNKRTWAYILIAGAAISIACFVLDLML